MAVTIGSARIDENGKAYGGAAGDQTGKEVSTQNWYKHSKGWRVFRAKDPAQAAKIAQAMQAACANNKIGYDQYQRDSLYNKAKAVGFDPAKVTDACETDCSALVRVCCAFAGITVGNFRTYNEPSMLLATGAFVELTGSKYTGQPDYLGAGDILCTPVSGHTVVVLTSGPKYDGTPVEVKYTLGQRVLKRGMSGADVTELQIRLKAVGFDCGAADGEYGPKTEGAVKALQKAGSVTIDGQFGPASLAVLLTLEPAEDQPAKPSEPQTGGKVKIIGGSVNVRSGPGTGYDVVDVAKSGDLLAYANPDEWIPVLLNGRVCWVSSKYAKVV